MSAVQRDPVEVAEMRAAGALVLDVREPWEVALVGLSDAMAIPLGQLPERWSEVPDDRPVVVLCHHGMRSRQATMFLRAQGREDVYNLMGGIDAYAARVDPSLARY